MYIESLKIYVVNLPKCGSTSMKAAIEAAHGKCRLPGHLRLSRAAAHINERFTAVALIRDPVERFASACNFRFADAPHVTLDDAMRQGLRHGETVIFKPQSVFLDSDVPVRLWRFEEMNAALASLGCSPAPHANKSLRRWSADDIRPHPRFRELREKYAADFELRRLIQNAEPSQ